MIQLHKQSGDREECSTLFSRGAWRRWSDGGGDAKGRGTEDTLGSSSRLSPIETEPDAPWGGGSIARRCTPFLHPRGKGIRIRYCLPDFDSCSLNDRRGRQSRNKKQLYSAWMKRESGRGVRGNMQSVKIHMQRMQLHTVTSPVFALPSNQTSFSLLPSSIQESEHLLIVD